MRRYCKGRNIITAVCFAAIAVSAVKYTAYAEDISVQSNEIMQQLPATDSQISDFGQYGTAEEHKKTIETGVYSVESNGKSMQAEQNRTGSRITMQDKTTAGSQSFLVEYIGEGKYKIRSFAGDGNGLGASENSEIKLKKTADEFYINEKSDGEYTIVPSDDESLALQAEKSGAVLAKYNFGDSQSWKFDDDVKEDEAQVLASLADIQKKYPNGKQLSRDYSFNSGYQCMGFGREIFYRTFGTKTAWYYDGRPKTAADKKNFKKIASSSSYSEKSIRELISNAHAGDILQMNAPKIHTMVYVSSDDNGFTVYDANWTGENKVSLRYVKYSDWKTRNSSGICVLHSTSYPAK